MKIQVRKKEDGKEPLFIASNGKGGSEASRLAKFKDVIEFVNVHGQPFCGLKSDLKKYGEGPRSGGFTVELIGPFTEREIRGMQGFLAGTDVSLIHKEG